MTNCKEINIEGKTKFPLRVRVELKFDDKVELEEAINDLSEHNWAWENRLKAILKGK